MIIVFILFMHYNISLYLVLFLVLFHSLQTFRCSQNKLLRLRRGTNNKSDFELKKVEDQYIIYKSCSKYIYINLQSLCLVCTHALSRSTALVNARSFRTFSETGSSRIWLKLSTGLMLVNIVFKVRKVIHMNYLDPLDQRV